MSTLQADQRESGDRPAITTASPPVARLENVAHRYSKSLALDDVSVDVPSGCMVGLIGPDGVGKSTLMGLVSGAKVIQAGTVTVLDGDLADRRHRDDVCPRIAYMPQGLGKNLYAELSVFENLDFFGRLFLQPKSERHERIERLLKATGLHPFADRPAGKLSGGMKQKVGLCCALIHDPDLLLLDEPTTGVDPLSRQQFWTLIDDVRASRPEMSVLVSTAYMEEAERFDWLIAMDAGRVLATGTPEQLRKQTKTESLEDAFVQLLPEDQRGSGPLVIPARVEAEGPPAIVAHGLTKRFGDFVAVNNVNFSIARGEIFGFLGSNGCGKSTTMKMLTGLLPASEGNSELFGKPTGNDSRETRRRVGYMTQGFSLYGELTVSQNLWLHARLFHLPHPKQKCRIDELVDQFGLEDYFDQLASELPLGVRQRLSLAVAIIHSPEMLILDEPTSGVDPVARDDFWKTLVDLSRKQQVTIFISTHFMNEALRCDRISLMHAGNVLACDQPAKLVEARHADSLEEAFIGYIKEAIKNSQGDTPAEPPRSSELRTTKTKTAQPEIRPSSHSGFHLGRLLAWTYRESLELRRDPVRLAFAFFGSMLLMLVFGFGITMDVNRIDFAVLDLDQSPDSRAYINALSGSRFFEEQPEVRNQDELERKLKESVIGVAIEIPPNFGRMLRQGDRPVISSWIDGAAPSRAATVKGYVEGIHVSYLQQRMAESNLPVPAIGGVQVEHRFRYNPTFESVYAIVPSVPALLLVVILAILMAVSVVKEKELGSITNFFVTPTTRLEFLVGKQLPYIVVGIVNFTLLTLMAVILFAVPLKGSGLMLVACAAAYVTAVTAIGLLVSTFTSSQVAAVFVTTIITVIPSVQFSGLLQPVSTLEGAAHWIGRFWPTTYYMHASVGAFTKGLSAMELLPDLLALLAFIPVLTLVTALALRKQER